jgi:hypothetical protein
MVCFRYISVNALHKDDDDEEEEEDDDSLEITSPSKRMLFPALMINTGLLAPHPPNGQ